MLLLFLKKTTVYKLQVEQPSTMLARKMTVAKNIEIANGRTDNELDFLLFIQW